MKCKIENCSKDAAKKRAGYCHMHYTRIRRTGSSDGLYPQNPDEKRLWIERAAQSETDECIVWPWAKAHGYPIVQIDKKPQRVHRLVLASLIPPPSQSSVARHGPCHNRACCNPRHLEWGDALQNAEDRTRDSTQPVGMKNPRSKLTDDQVRAIRADKRRYIDIADSYGVSKSSVGHIKKGNTWKHVN